MQSKNKPAPTVAERAHIERIKAMRCGVCAEAGPSEAHHVKQSSHFFTIPLCKGCHTGRNGIHGERHMWRLMKMDEVDALAKVIEHMGGLI